MTYDLLTRRMEMKSLTLASVIFIANLAFSVIGTATASAAATLPNVLPSGSLSEPVNFTGSSGKSTFGDGLEKVTSERLTYTASGNAVKGGTFNALFKEAKDVLGTACTG
jgi:hypothetical protein